VAGTGAVQALAALGAAATTIAVLTGGMVTAAPSGPSAAGGAMTASGPLAAAYPEASSTVELAPGIDEITDVVFGDDALYVVSTNDSNADIHRRPLTPTAAGTYAGDLTLVGQTLPYNVIAEHDGTVAYLRASDQTLVLEDAAGNETVPSWGGGGKFGQGVVDLSSAWVVGRDASGWERLWDRQTGTEIPIGELAGLPAEFPYHRVGWAFVTDDRVLWGMDSFNAAQDRFTGIYTMALDDDGAAGPVTTIDTAIRLENGDGAVLQPRGLEGGLLAWSRADCVGTACDLTLRWFSAAPYMGTPIEMTVVGEWLQSLDGTTIASVGGYPAVVVNWYTLGADDAAYLRSVDLPGPPPGMDDRFVAYEDGAGGWLLSDATGAPLTDGAPISFSDVQPGHLFYDDIMWLAENGITGGYPDGTFRPNASVNRDAMAAFLYRMDHDGARAPACTTAAFTDVPASHPFCGEIAWLASTGITTGWPDGTFRPSQAVTREAMAAFLYRFDHGPGRAPACTYSPFGDVLASHPFCGEIAWMAEQGISTGWVDGTFRPSLTIERQAMAAFLHRFATRN